MEYKSEQKEKLLMYSRILHLIRENIISNTKWSVELLNALTKQINNNLKN